MASPVHRRRSATGAAATCGTSANATSSGMEPPYSAGSISPTPSTAPQASSSERHRSATASPAPTTSSPTSRPIASGR